jgi:assimilatory nitrate reductase catalytic subunit
MSRYRRCALDLPEGVRTDLQVLKGLAERLGAGAQFSDDSGAMFDELRRAETRSATATA